MLIGEWDGFFLFGSLLKTHCSGAVNDVAQQCLKTSERERERERVREICMRLERNQVLGTKTPRQQ